jgi:hypothetical protein
MKEATTGIFLEAGSGVCSTDGNLAGRTVTGEKGACFLLNREGTVS